jgi:hypothetical protein
VEFHFHIHFPQQHNIQDIYRDDLLRYVLALKYHVLHYDHGFSLNLLDYIHHIQNDHHQRDDDCPFDIHDLGNNRRDYDQSNDIDDCEPNDNLNILRDHKPDHNEYLFPDDGYGACSPAYSWLPVGIDPGGTRVRPTGRASHLSKAAGKQETPIIIDFQAVVAGAPRNAALVASTMWVYHSIVSTGRFVDSI